MSIGCSELRGGVFTETFPAGEVAVAITAPSRKAVALGETPSTEPNAGNVVRRLCELNGEACASVGCLALAGYGNEAKDCAERNYLQVFETLGVKPDRALIVSLTADRVGFYDELDNEEVKVNSVGIREVSELNAFFARASDEVAFGGRFADCGFVALEFKDSKGEDVIGFMHLTRTNLHGESQLQFEVDGRPAGSFEYFLDTALKHYGADKRTVTARLVTAINGENFPHTFDPASEEHEGGHHPDGRFPGWLDQGLIYNQTNPDWDPSEGINPEDVWIPMYREMLRWQIGRAGLEPHQVIEEDVLDPAVLERGYSSNHAGYFGQIPQSRDAYVVMPRAMLNYSGF